MRHKFSLAFVAAFAVFPLGSAFAALVAKNPNGAALATLPDIAPLLHA